MATYRQRLHRKNSSGSYDTIHLETSAKAITGILDAAHGGTGYSSLDALAEALNTTGKIKAAGVSVTEITKIEYKDPYTVVSIDPQDVPPQWKTFLVSLTGAQYGNYNYYGVLGAMCHDDDTDYMSGYSSHFYVETGSVGDGGIGAGAGSTAVTDITTSHIHHYAFGLESANIYFWNIASQQRLYCLHNYVVFFS